MNAPKTHDYTPRLRQMMQARSLSSFKELSDRSQVSEKQVRSLRFGRIGQMKLETLNQLAIALGISIETLLAEFGDRELDHQSSVETTTPELEILQQEYQRLQLQLSQQKENLWQEFQQASLNTLEPWLLQWSAAAYAAQQNPQLSAAKILPLVRPIERLLEQWGIEATAIVGSEVPYDPQAHQLMDGTANPGDRVRVRYAGYRQGDRSLYRTKVSPVI